MRDSKSLISNWKDMLRARGHSSDLVWLPGESMILRWKQGDNLGRVYIRPVEPPLTEAQIYSALALLPDTEPGVFLLVGSADYTYVTLLMDPFGSDDCLFFEKDNFYFHAERYSNELLFVTSSIQWCWLRIYQRLSPHLSSLDYAFTFRQTRKV